MWCRSPSQRRGLTGPSSGVPRRRGRGGLVGGLGGDDTMDGERTGEQRLACWLCPGVGHLLAQTLIWADLLLESLDLCGGWGEAVVRVGSRPLGLKGQPPQPGPCGSVIAAQRLDLHFLSLELGRNSPPSCQSPMWEGLAIPYAERSTPALSKV